MIPITLAQYLGPWKGHEDATADVLSCAGALLARVNRVLAIAEAGGLVLLRNPKTHCYVAGNGNGGFRPLHSSVGAASSKHKSGHAVDIYDPYRELAKWCALNPMIWLAEGLSIENFKWTPSWVHFQDIPPGSGKPFFIPSRDDALCGPVAGQGELERMEAAA